MDAGEAIEDTADSVDAALAVQVRYLENHAVRHYAGSIRGAGAGARSLLVVGLVNVVL